MNDFCDCHECTQARWRSSLQGQIETAMRGRAVAPSRSAAPLCEACELEKRNGGEYMNHSCTRRASAAPPSVNYVQEVRPDDPPPSCHRCGAVMVPTRFNCRSCGATTEPTEAAPPSEREALDHSPLPWTFTYFTKPDGTEIETPQDVADTVAASALKCEGTKLWGVSLDETDAEGRTLVICYTGNGPHSEANARLIAAAVNALNITQARAAVPQAALTWQDVYAALKEELDHSMAHISHHDENATVDGEVDCEEVAKFLNAKLAAAVPAPGNQKLIDALQKIATHYGGCRCNHLTNDCCENPAVDEFCPHCISEIAIRDSGVTPKEK